MIRKFLALALAAALAACGAPPEDWPSPSPALWEVTGPDGQSAWLFGTIHALPRGVNWRTEPLERALKGADTLVVEVADLDDKQAGARAYAAAARGSGLPPLLDRAHPADLPALRQALDRAGLKPEEFRVTDTWAAALVIANSTTSGDHAAGVDRALLDGGLPVVGLEGFVAQFALFDALPPEDQADLLGLTLAEIDRDGRAAQLAWLTGDLDALERNELGGVIADPGLYQALIVDRNHAWVNRIVEMLERGNRPFVAVGAGHMIGTDGLPALLAARGYTVRRIQ